MIAKPAERRVLSFFDNNSLLAQVVRPMGHDWLNFPAGDYAKAKDFARSFYATLMPMPCPAIGGLVVRFNSAGFQHLVRRVPPRPHADQLRRFLLLRHVPHVIADKGVEVLYTERAEGKTRFWCLRTEVAGEFVRVVIRQVGAGHHHFFSVMNEKRKNLR